MSTYAIGDIQGCYHELRQLLAHIGFERGRDTLWFCGDLVNRGPQSLATLRFVRDLGDAAVTVLGNHDLHLLAVGTGAIAQSAKDSFDDVLRAPERAQLLDWLCAQPLLHHDAALGYTLVHAGLPPQWDLFLAQDCAEDLSMELRGPAPAKILKHLYGNQPAQWSSELSGRARLRFISNCLTRIRYCDRAGRLNLSHKGPPGTQPENLLPWFAVPGRASAALSIVFGHWSSLGFCPDASVHPLDTGCLWGGRLTALRLTGPGAPERLSIPCNGAQQPHR